MPELPEVEASRRALVPVLEGATIGRVRVDHARAARRNRSRAEMVRRLHGRHVRRLRRHGKFLIGDLDDGHLVVHLGMSGRLRLAEPGERLEPHTHVRLAIGETAEVRFVDPRTFGWVAAWTSGELADRLAHLGPDAWDAPPETRQLAPRLAGRRAPIKALLLDQRIVAGLGNIYADEILHRAGVHGARPGGSLADEEIDRIVAAMRPVLAEAIAAGGTSLADLAYLLPDGRAGDQLARLAVYGRTGRPCRVCDTPIERVVIAQRSHHLCPRCQPRTPIPWRGTERARIGA